MLTCIFCPAQLDETTSPEHILNSALGGRKKTRGVICTECNNKFGGRIDRVLAEQFAVVRNLLQLPSGTGSPPPALKNVKAGRDTIEIGGDGKISLITKPFTIGPQLDAGRRLHVSGESLEQIEAMLPHIAAALKMSEARLREQVVAADMTFTERRPDPVRLDFQFGGSDAIRSAAKSCLVLWATLVGNDEIKGVHYAGARLFVTDGDEGFLSTKTFLDSRLYEDLDQITAAYGPVFNLIYIRSDKAGRVVGHFTCYNLIAYSIVLAESGGSPERKIALASNPLTRVWSDRFAGTLDVPFEWFESPDYDYDDMQRSRQRFDTVMRLHFEMTKNDRLNDIIRDVLTGHGLKEGDLIPREMAASISKELSERFTHHVFNRPYSKPFTAAQIQEAFGRKPSSSDS